MAYKDGHARIDPTKEFLQLTAELTLTASTVASTLISTDQTVEGQFAAPVVNGNRTLSSPVTATISSGLVLRSPEDDVILGSAFARPQPPAIVAPTKSPGDLAMWMREVSGELRRRTPADLDPTDLAFTLEAISGRVGEPQAAAASASRTMAAAK